VLDHLLATSGDQAFSLNKSDTRSYKTAATTKRNKAPKSGGPLITLRELVDENFFSEPRSLRDILDEFNKRSQRLKPTDLTKPLQIVCRQKLLRRDKQSPANGGKKVFHWYNW
jgi:hypothetical protein